MREFFRFMCIGALLGQYAFYVIAGPTPQSRYTTITLVFLFILTFYPKKNPPDGPGGSKEKGEHETDIII